MYYVNLKNRALGQPWANYLSGTAIHRQRRGPGFNSQIRLNLFFLCFAFRMRDVIVIFDDYVLFSLKKRQFYWEWPELFLLIN